MLGGISIWQLLIVLGIVILIFGTKKLRNLGGDLGNAVKGFKEAMGNAEQENDQQIEKKEADDIIGLTAQKSDSVKDKLFT